MNASVQNFKLRNEEVLKMLDEVRAIGLTSAQAQKKFYEAKGVCLSLYEDEHRTMHPLVLESAKNDQYLTQTINFFIGEVTQCYRVIENFFHKYPAPTRGLDFAQDFGVVYAAMIQRARLEVHTLQGIYLEQMQNAQLAKSA